MSGFLYPVFSPLLAPSFPLLSNGWESCLAPLLSARGFHRSGFGWLGALVLAHLPAVCLFKAYLLGGLFKPMDERLDRLIPALVLATKRFLLYGSLTREIT